MITYQGRPRVRLAILCSFPLPVVHSSAPFLTPKSRPFVSLSA